MRRRKTDITLSQPTSNAFTFLPGELFALTAYPRIPVSTWAEKNRIIAYGGKTRIQYRNENVIYMKDILDCFSLPHVREIVVMKSPQVGMTEGMLTCMLYAIQRDPEIILYIMPNEVLAKKTSSDRILPAICESKATKHLISSNPDDTAKTRIKFKNGAIVYLAWANSSAALSSFSVKYIFFDEVDKYPSSVRKEVDPIKLGEKRATVYENTYKIFKVSTPTTPSGHIYKAYNEAEIQLEWISKCPKCGEEFVISLDYLDYKVEKNKVIYAFIKCPGCHELLDNGLKQKAVNAGRWNKIDELHINKPKTVAFHIPAFISPFVSLETIAKAYHQSQKDEVKKQDFYNNFLGLPYEKTYEETNIDFILRLRDDRPKGLVPSVPIVCLIASFDTQLRGFYYEVRAWGFGYAMESWQIDFGYIETWEDVYKIMREYQYEDINKKKYTISAGFIDSGAGAGSYGISRTVEVYDFCRQVNNLFPIKGYKRRSHKFGISHIDHYPQSTKPIPGGLRLYVLDVTYYKDYLASKLRIDPGSEGAWHLCADADESYARQMTAEYKNDKGYWEAHKNRANHYWDCAVYNLACADIIGIKYLPEEMEEIQQKVITPKIDKLIKVKRKRW